MFHVQNVDKLTIKTGWNSKGFVNYKPMDVKSPEIKTATASDGAITSNNRQVVLQRQVKLVDYIQDPLTESQKQMIESVVRRNLCVRTAMFIRQQAAFRKSKLFIELPEEEALNLSDEEKKSKIEELKKNPQVMEIYKKIAVLDRNLNVPQYIRKLFSQWIMYGRGLIIIFYEDEQYSKIKRLMSINSRRLGDPILDKNNAFSFEGCMVDNQPLSKDSMIYGIYNEDDLSAHTEGFGYPPIETVLYIAEAHNIATEEDMGEIVKSAWLPTLVMKMNLPGLSVAQKNTKMQQIIDILNPGKIVGVDTEDVEEVLTLDMKPDFAGLKLFIDSWESKIYNAFHVPLFIIKSDEIANFATAKAAGQIFIDNTVANDQELMEETWAEQWYDPLVKEELARTGNLETDIQDQSPTENKNTTTPEGDEMPMPFVIRRRFEKIKIEEFNDLVSAISTLKRDGIWDIQKANELLNTEEVTPRVILENEKKEQKELEKMEMQVDQQKQLGQKKPFAKSPV